MQILQVSKESLPNFNSFWRHISFSYLRKGLASEGDQVWNSTEFLKRFGRKTGTS